MSDISASRYDASLDDHEDATLELRDDHNSLWRWGIRTVYHSAAFLVSFIFHFVLLMVMAMFTLTDPVKEQQLVTVIEPDMVEDLETFEIELDDLDKISTEMEVANIPAAEMGMEGSVVASMTAPVLEQEAIDPTEHLKIEFNDLAMLTKDTDSLIQDIPSGTVGSAQAVVGDYQEAMDQISQEIIWMLSRNKVLVVWLFDQSESMKDDQERISQRIGRVYAEIGLTEEGQGDMLTTSVCAYGQGFHLMTKAPTSNLTEIEEAIKKIEIDRSGEEMGLSAVGEALTLHRKYAQVADRKIALIVVTDESGNDVDNQTNLEKTINLVNKMDCRVFVMGREAMFGYPYAHYEWIHPVEGTTHLLRIDRGPETAYVEQLQTDGFGKRWDALTSGFGPYSQVRLAKETGGMFFMLPGQEDDIHYVTDKKYDPKIMDRFRPDLRPRAEQVGEIKGDPLKSLLTNVVYDLNPYNKETAPILEIRRWYSRELPKMIEQVRVEQTQVLPYGKYLDKAIVMMEKNKHLRDESTSVRWQANFDLIHGQLYGYRARAYEYGVSSEQFLKKPTQPNPDRAKYLEFRGWKLNPNKKLVAPKQTDADAKRATEILTQVTEEYAGTPWASRAAWEVKRGFSARLEPYYFDTRKRKPSDMKVEIPKL